MNVRRCRLTTVGCEVAPSSATLPLQPNQILALFERRVDGDDEPSRLAWRLVAGDRDSVRYYDETRHHTSSHLTDSRIAELMISAIE